MRTRLFLLGAALVAFGASLGSGFHLDDFGIFSSPSLTSSNGWISVWNLRDAQPLTNLTFWLNYQVGGGDPVGYHLLNLLLHIGAVLLAYECLRRCIAETAAAAGAALFAVHPIQAEAVDYVWARGIILATLLCLAALREWLDDRPWAAVGWFAAALLAKPEVAAFPLVLLLVTGKRRASPVVAMLVLSVAAGARIIYSAAAGPHAPIPPGRFLLAQGPVTLRYLRLFAVPYGFTIDPDVRVPPLWLGVLAWAGVAALAYSAWRYSRWALAGLVLLLPSSAMSAAADLSADRRMYFPVLFLSAAVALVLARYGRVALAPAAVCLVLAFARTEVWMTERSLWAEAVERAPEKIRPKVELARSLPAAEGLELLGKAREMAPNDPEVAEATGKILLSEGQADAALTEFDRAIALEPRNAVYVNDRGVALATLGHREAARADFQRALEIDPALAEARQNLEKLGPAR